MLFSLWPTIWLFLQAMYPLLSSQTNPSNQFEYCQSPYVDPTAACWDHLNVTGHLNDWWNENEAICNSAPYDGNGFASCYQQRHGFLESHCNDISLDCVLNLNYSKNTPQTNYVLQTIYNLWFWFSSVWFAAVPATLQADLQASQIVQTINPVHPGDTSLGALLSALSAGFAFLALPAGLGTVGSKFAATAVGQAPGLVKGLLPTGSLNSEFTQLAKIDQALGKVMEAFQEQLAETLQLTMNDYASFLTLASNGSFIPKKDGALNASTVELKSYLSTFVVSQALQANNIILTVAQGVSPFDITNNLTNFQGSDFDVFAAGSGSPNYAAPENNATYPILPQIKQHVNCRDPYDEYGVCDNWWYDDESRSAYALYKLDNMGKNFYDLMETMFRNGWTTRRDLFGGSVDCTLDISPGNGSGYDRIPFLWLDSYTLEPHCAANLKTCTWNPASDPRLKDGYELMGIAKITMSNYREGPADWAFGGCSYAWPDVCENMTVNITYTDITYRLEANTQPQADHPLLNFTTFASTNITNVKNCHKDFNDRGLGGAGYHQDIQTECDKWPASYLGPGFWLDTEFCGP